MNPFAFAFRRSVRPLSWAALAAIVATVIAVVTWPAPLELGASSQGAAALWLPLPGIVLGLTFVAAAFEAWPLIGVDRPGTANLARVATGPLGGSGAAVGGALVALATASVLTGCAFSLVHDLLGHPLRAARHTAELTFDGPVYPGRACRADAGGATLASLQLRASFVFVRDPERAVPFRAPLRILLDDEVVAEPIATLSNDRLSVEFAPRPVRQVRIEATAANAAPLAFRRGAAQGEGPDAYAGMLNSVAAHLAFAIPSLVGAALMVLLGMFVRGPFALAGGVVGVLVVAAIANGPGATATSELLGGTWILTGRTPAAAGIGLGASAILLALAWLVRKGRRA